MAGSGLTLAAPLIGHLLLTPGDDLLRSDGGTGLEDDEGLDLLAVAGVRDADHGGQADRGMRDEDFLDLAGVDVEAPRIIRSLERSTM